MTGTPSTPYADLIVWLEDHAVPFELREHPLSYTAEATAYAEGIDPRTFAKVVGVRTSAGENLLVVVDASDEVDLGKLTAHLGVDWVTLLTEGELGALLPGCEVGAIPPVPELTGVDVVADEAVRADPFISFPAGSHRHSARVDRAAWETSAGIRYGSFARPRR